MFFFSRSFSRELNPQGRELRNRLEEIGQAEIELEGNV